MLNDIKTKNIQLRYPHKSYVGVTNNNSKKKISYTFAADIKNSRYGDSSRWADLTALLEKSRILLNAIFENNLEKEVVFSGGDSIQGVFNRPEHAYMYGRLLQKLFYPEKIKVGIGIGEVFSYYEDKNSNYSTGQAFINAQSALNRAKSNDIDVQISSYESNVDEINIMLEMISSIRGTQTDYQKELDLMTEILFPFVTLSMFNTSYKLIEIINFKNSLTTFNITSSTDSSDSRIDIFIKNLESDISNYIKPILINKYVNKNLMELIELANVYGIQSDLALLTQSTKQNISKMFNKAKIEQLRKYDIVIIKRLGDVNNGITDIESYIK